MLKGVFPNVQQAIYSTKPTSSKVVPTSGQTVAFANNNQDQIIWLAPAGSLASLTIALPTDASSPIGQEVRFGTSQSITSLTMTGATMIYNAATTLATGEQAEYLKVDSNTWVRL